MSISFSGLVSGLDTSSWVESLTQLKQAKVTTLTNQKTAIQTQKSALNTVKSSFSTLQSLLQKLTDTKFGNTETSAFTQNVANVSDTSVLSAVASTSAKEGSYAVTVNNVATNTTMHSNKLNTANNSTTLGSLGVTSGTLTLYNNGEALKLNVDSTWTIDDLNTAIHSKTSDVTATWSDGKLNISGGGNVLHIGANTDTSNFSSIFNMQSTNGGTELESSRTIYGVNGSTNITSLGIKTGDFVLGNATFTIDSDTTFNDLISQINASEDANATAYLDTTNGELVIKSRTAGASLINVEAVTSNFTDVMGFTTGSFEKEITFDSDATFQDLFDTLDEYGFSPKYGTSYLYQGDICITDNGQDIVAGTDRTLFNKLDLIDKGSYYRTDKSDCYEFTETDPVPISNWSRFTRTDSVTISNWYVGWYEIHELQSLGTTPLSLYVDGTEIDLEDESTDTLGEVLELLNLPEEDGWYGIESNLDESGITISNYNGHAIYGSVADALGITSIQDYANITTTQKTNPTTSTATGDTKLRDLEAFQDLTISEKAVYEGHTLFVINDTQIQASLDMTIDEFVDTVNNTIGADDTNPVMSFNSSTGQLSVSDIYIDKTETSSDAVGLFETLFGSTFATEDGTTTSSVLQEYSDATQPSCMVDYKEESYLNEIFGDCDGFQIGVYDSNDTFIDAIDLDGDMALQQLLERIADAGFTVEGDATSGYTFTSTDGCYLADITGTFCTSFGLGTPEWSGALTQASSPVALHTTVTHYADASTQISLVTGTANNQIKFTNLNEKQTSYVNTANQTLGTNASFTIDGVEHTSTSNTVASDISGITGVTLNLKDVSAGETVTVEVTKDSENLTSTVSDIVDGYNSFISTVNNALSSSGSLSDQTTLKYLKNQIRSVMSSALSSLPSGYRTLNSIGIEIEEASADNISTEGLDTYTFNSTQFEESFQNNSEALESLLVGTSTSEGLFSQVENIISNALSSSGYFSTTSKSFTKQIETINDKITRQNTIVSNYKSRLEAKFSAMELLLSNLQQQYSSFLSSSSTSSSVSSLSTYV